MKKKLFFGGGGGGERSRHLAVVVAAVHSFTRLSAEIRERKRGRGVRENV